MDWMPVFLLCFLDCVIKSLGNILQYFIYDILFFLGKNESLNKRALFKVTLAIEEHNFALLYSI